VVLSVIAIVLGITVLSGLYLSRYQPLSANGTGASWADPRYAERVGSFTPPEGASFSVYRLRYVDGHSFRYALTLFNEGPLPVTITNVGEAFDCESCTFPLVFERSALAPSSGQYQFNVEHSTPFERFVLEPGAFRLVVIETRFDNCESYSPRSGVDVLSIPVAYRTGFLHHEVLLPMPFTLEVRFRGPECPGGLQAAA
jgi:hypothetical protein